MKVPGSGCVWTKLSKRYRLSEAKIACSQFCGMRAIGAKVAKGSVKHRSEDKEGHGDNPPTCARDCISFLR